MTDKELKALEVEKKTRDLLSDICGKLYDCDADWCPLEVLVGLSGLKGNRCHLHRLLEDIKKEKK